MILSLPLSAAIAIFYSNLLISALLAEDAKQIFYQNLNPFKTNLKETLIFRPSSSFRVEFLYLRLIYRNPRLEPVAVPL
jgi:hypothetical protein